MRFASAQVNDAPVPPQFSLRLQLFMRPYAVKQGCAEGDEARLLKPKEDIYVLHKQLSFRHLFDNIHLAR